MREIDGNTTESVETRLRRAYADLAPSHGFEEGLDATLSETAQGARRPVRWAVPATVAAAVALAAVVLWAPRSADDSPAASPGPAGGGAPLVDEVAVDAERAQNSKAYARLAAGLKKDHAGEWVVIAGGRLVAQGARIEDVQGAAPQALHRFVFEVGKEGDREEFVSGWYGPRFAGPTLAAALRVDWQPGTHFGTTLTKEGGKSFGPVGTAPFPRVPMHVNPPDADPARPSHGPLDVFLGTVGPPLMLMPWDWLSRGLARFEIPGTMNVFGGDCRMATALVSIPELDARALVVASCPAFPRERLVEMARHRDAFWNWGWQLAQQVAKGHEGKWVVFAADRVIGEGDSPEAALRAARGKPDGYYHRYVVKVPRVLSLAIDESAWGEGRRAWLNGVEVTARGGPGAMLFVGNAAEAAAIGLEMAEEGRDVVLQQGDTRTPARAGYAWLTKDRGSPMSSGGPPVLVVYPAPPEPVPVPVAPTVARFSPAGPFTDGMLTKTADPEYPGTIVVFFAPPKPGEIFDHLESAVAQAIVQVLRFLPGTGNVPVAVSRMDVRNDRVALTPARLPLEDGQYSVVVNLPKPVFHSFIVGTKDDVAPVVVTTSPANGVVGVGAGVDDGALASSPEVSIRMSEAIEEMTVTPDSVRVEDAGSVLRPPPLLAPQPGFPRLRESLQGPPPASSQFEIVWRPDPKAGGLPFGTTIRVTVVGADAGPDAKAVMDRAGNRLAKSYSFTFRTVDPPTPPGPK